jgi:predicted Rossmann fold flavoprotein
MAGTSFENAKITFYLDGIKKFSKTGKILCTHFGLSGPLILNTSAELGDLLHVGVVTATINVFPTIDQGVLEDQLVTLFDENKNKMLKNVLRSVLPSGMSTSILSLLTGTLTADRKTNGITKEERKELVRLLTSLPLTVTGLMGFDRAVVADGGVLLSEIDTKAMRSRIVPNLYIVGDLLAIYRPSGGYSLQLCWTTGYIAGEHA